MDYYSRRLVREIELLQRCEAQFELKAKPIIDQLVADADRLLPDHLPQPPAWIDFEWPRSGEIDLRSHWKLVDRIGWRGEYL